jgi:hypothetical protein
MKKLLFVLAALAILSLAAPVTGFAQLDPPAAANQIGLYTVPVDTTDLASSEFTVLASVPFFAYLCVTKPQDNAFNAVELIEAFECRVTFDNPTAYFKLAETLPPQAINVGDTSSLVNGLDYAVGLGTPLPVVNGGAVLVTYQFFSATAASSLVFVGPSPQGNLYYQEALGKTLVDFYPSSSDPTLPIAGFNATPVATESETWGSVKSLYR